MGATPEAMGRLNVDHYAYPERAIASGRPRLAVVRECPAAEGYEQNDSGVQSKGNSQDDRLLEVSERVPREGK